VAFNADQGILTIQKSKTDQYGKSERRPISRASGSCCAVANLERWMERLPQAEYLFPNLSTASTIVDRAMSKDAVRAELARVLEACGITRHLTPHSFRGGAATLAIEQGVPVHAVMSMGRWESLGGFAPYVQVNSKTLAGADKLF
jgi:integrase